MALPRRVLPSRVPLPAEAGTAASVAAPVNASVSTPVTPAPAPVEPVATPSASADLAALGALMAEGLTPTPQPVQPVAEPEPTSVMVEKPVEPAVAEAAPAPVAEVPATPVEEPQFAPVVAAAPAPVVEKPAAVEAKTSAPTPAPAAPAPKAEKLQPAPAMPAPVAASTEPSRPDDNPLRRRVRQPRAFTFTPPAEESKAEVKPAAAAPATVANAKPVPAASPAGLADTTPLDEVDDRLQEAGILPLPEPDALTASLPPSVASIEPPAPEPIAVSPAMPVAESIAVTPTPEPLPVVEPKPAAPLASLDQPAVLPVATAQPAPATLIEPVALVAPAMATSSLPWATPVATGTAPATPTESASWNQPWGTLPPTSEATVSAPPAPQPTPDVYGFHGGPQVGPFAQAQGVGGGGSHVPPPSLPTQYSSKGKSNGGQGGGGSKGGNWQIGLAAAVVVAALFGAYQLVSRKEASPTQLALQTPAAAPGNPSPTLLPPPVAGSNGLPANNLFAGTPISGSTSVSDSNVQIGFADVPADQANKPIVADGTEKMPSDVGFVAQLQTAISKEQAKKNGADAAATPATATAATPASATDKTAANTDLKAQLANELAAYRKALANTPPGEPAPKPAQFMGKAGAAGDASATVTADATPVTGPNGDLLPPPQLAGSGQNNGQGGGLLPPAELYKNNPKGLPVVPEPTAAAEPKVRQLTDFNVSMFAAPEHDRVRIPAGIKPRFSTTDFPQMDVLSFVPGKGVIAYHDGKEGVLLLGESIDGWQLNRVNADNAEFKNGQRSQYVTAE